MPEDKTLEDKTPEVKTPEDKPASQAIVTLAESFEKVSKSAAAAVLIFLIVFGCCYKWGEDHGQDAGRQIRLEHGKHNLNTLPGGEAVLFWKDDAIIQGGLYGFLTVAVLSTYVVFLFIFLRPAAEGRGEWVAKKLLYPNVMSAATVLVFLIDGGLRFNPNDLGIFALLTGFAACSWRWRSLLGIQIMLLVGQALLISFLFGENRGFASADLESHYPLVEVRDTSGTPTKDLRLLKCDDSECRFVDANGLEQIIPKAQIRAIIMVPESAPAATAKPK